MRAPVWPVGGDTAIVGGKQCSHSIHGSLHVEGGDDDAVANVNTECGTPNGLGRPSETSVSRGCVGAMAAVVTGAGTSGVRPSALHTRAYDLYSILVVGRMRPDGTWPAVETGPRAVRGKIGRSGKPPMCEQLLTSGPYAGTPDVVPYRGITAARPAGGGMSRA